MGLYKAKAGETFLLYGSLIPKENWLLPIPLSAIFTMMLPYLEGGELIISKNKFYSTGNKGGEGVNIKSGVLCRC